MKCNTRGGTTIFLCKLSQEEILINCHINKKNLPRFQMGHTCYSLCNEYCTEKIHLFNNFKVCIIGIVYIHIMTGMMANNHLFLLSLFLTVEFHAYNYYLRVNKANQCMDLYISCYKDYISKVISVLT